MPSMKQQREINDLSKRVDDLSERVESLERTLGQVISAKESKKEPAKKRAKNGSV